MKKIKYALTHTMVDLKTVVICVVLAVALAISGTMFGVSIRDSRQQNSYEVVCDVVAETQDTYIVKSQANNELFEIDKSGMFGVGETILINYTNNQLTNIWLYVDT